MTKEQKISQLSSTIPFTYFTSHDITKRTDIHDNVIQLQNRAQTNEVLNEILNTLKTLSHQVSVNDQKIGIPTFEGYVFSEAHEIIRCEGLQKCTRIFFKNEKNIVSSYNIGCFENLLSPYNFFVCHKSHMINMNAIKRYNKNGELLMSDGSVVPVSRRRRKSFMEQFAHI